MAYIIAMSDKHLNRYLVEFDTRANTKDMSEGDRVEAFLEAIIGYRLTYKNLIYHE